MTFRRPPMPPARPPRPPAPPGGTPPEPPGGGWDYYPPGYFDAISRERWCINLSGLSALIAPAGRVARQIRQVIRSRYTLVSWTFHSDTLPSGSETSGTQVRPDVWAGGTRILTRELLRQLDAGNPPERVLEDIKGWDAGTVQFVEKICLGDAAQ